MFVSDKLVFTELHKTGGTHICHWLAKLVGGQQIGKHNRIPEHLWDRFIIGSVRNPWDWYVSLWAYGCAGEGSVRRQATRQIDLGYMVRELPAEMGRRWPHPVHSARQLWHDAAKPAAAWRELYQDPEDVGAFRQWLRMMMDPARRFDVGEGFGFSPISLSFGLLTYRYMKLFTRLGPELYRTKELATLGGLTKVWRRKALASFIIRNECLEDDLLNALVQAGCTITDRQREALLDGKNAKINASKRMKTSNYFDEASAQLVLEREAFIVNQYGYSAPPPTDI